MNDSLPTPTPQEEIDKLPVVDTPLESFKTEIRADDSVPDVDDSGDLTGGAETEEVEPEEGEVIGSVYDAVGESEESELVDHDL